jgi:hypothetical protein
MKTMYRVFLLILILSVPATTALAQKVLTLEEVAHPFQFYVDTDRIYVTEGVKIYIYSLKDYRLIKTFGKEGEGPGEILLRRRGGNDQVLLTVLKDFLVVNTVSKLIYFSKEGEFIKEKKTTKAGRWLAPFENMFLGKKFIRKKDGLYHAVVLYDADLEPVKEIYKHKHGWQGPNVAFNPLTVDQADFETGGGKIFVVDGAYTTIRAYGKSGKELYAISNTGELAPFTDEHKNDMIAGYQRNSFWKRMYETRKHLFKFPKTFPPIRGVFLDAAAKKLYLKTHKVEKEKRKWFVYDFNGIFLKKLALPFGRYRFADNTAYRLLENEDEETWEVHIFKMH